MAVVFFVTAVESTAQPSSKCELPTSGVFEQAGVLCQDQMPASKGKCREFLDTIATVGEPTHAQSLALAFGRSWAAHYEGHQERRTAERLSRDELRALVRDNPNDPMLHYALAAFEDDAVRRVNVLRRTVDLEPGCEKAVHFLVRALPNESDADRAVRLRYLMLGYEHADSWKLHFAALTFLAHIDDGEEATGTEFRRRVVRDTKLEELPLDPENRSANLDLICHGDSFLLRLEALCIDAIRRLAKRDADGGRPFGKDVLSAVATMANAARSVGLASPSGPVAHFGKDGIEYVVALRDLLDRESEVHRSAEYHMAYAELAGPERKVEELRKAWTFDPANGAVGLQVAEALKRDGRHDAAIKVYRTVIANDDGRACFEWGPEQCATVAEQELQTYQEQLARDER